jgi:hypothetical protein
VRRWRNSPVPVLIVLMILGAAAGITRLRGAETVIVGMPPDVAFSMIQLGLRLDGVATALDLEEGLARFRAPTGAAAGSTATLTSTTRSSPTPQRAR